VNALKLLFLRSLFFFFLFFFFWISALGSIFLLLWTFLVCCTLDCMPLGELVLCSYVLEMSSFSDKFCFLILKRRKKNVATEGCRTSLN
jgi:hypothetical protein